MCTTCPTHLSRHGLGFLVMSAEETINGMALCKLTKEEIQNCVFCRKTYGSCVFSIQGNLCYMIPDHHCGLEVSSLPVTLRARVRSPVRSISCLRIFRVFSLNRKTNVRKFRPYSSPVIIWRSYIIQTIYHPSTDVDAL